MLTLSTEIGSLVRESYPLIPPYAYALIQTDSKTKETVYSEMQPPLTTKETNKLKLIEK